MKLRKILDAQKAIIEITQMSFPPEIARALMKLRQKIQNEYDFAAEEEAKFITKLVKKDDNGMPIMNDKGQMLFENNKDANIFNNHIRSLLEAEIDNIPSVTIRDSDVLDKEIKPEIMYLLCDFINFIEG